LARRSWDCCGFSWACEVSATYRVRQLLRAIAAQVTEEEQGLLRRYLPPPAVQVFHTLPGQDQRHSLDVFRALLRDGESDPDLLVAALMHDAGKTGAGLTVFHRTAIVLLAAAHPTWLRRLADSRLLGRRNPFWRHLHHAQVGAELMQAAGCSEATVWLIRHHHDPEPAADGRRRALLAALQREDRRH